MIASYIETTSKEKTNIIEVTYQYWDGSHPETTMRVEKGITIGDFISRVITQLSKRGYKDMETAPVEGFMLVKGDFIIHPVRENRIS